MVIVTLIATLASAMVWQQWRAVQVESAAHARAQSAWVLSGALDWARLILREGARASSAGAGAGVDHLGQPWAVPLAEARLSTFLAADKDNTDDGPEAFLSGSITDAQSRYDLRNLIGTDGKPIVEQVLVLGRLCQTVGLPSSVATQIVEGLRAAMAGTPVASAPLMPHRVDQLTWLGVDPASVAALAPYVVLLPTAQPVNVNTASAEVLAAVVPGLDLGTAQRLVQLRRGTPFMTPGAFAEQVPGVTVPIGAVAVGSDYFDVSGRLRLADHVLEQRSLVQRVNDQVNVIATSRLASTDDGSPSAH
jgi:general secretion pathway protein K